MCLTLVPAPDACPAAQTLLFDQIKALPRAEQLALLDQLHDLVYHPFYAVLSGPDYRPKPASAHATT